MDPDKSDVESTTPAGETGVADLREAQESHGTGQVADAAGVRSAIGGPRPLPSGELDEDAHRADSKPEHRPTGEGPHYEREQGRADPGTGGSADPHNTMTHANSGDETEEGD